MSNEETVETPAPIESSEKPAYHQELERAISEMGGPRAKAPNGSHKIEKEETEDEAAQAIAPTPAAKPEPVTQEKLSSGFAKLARQQKAAAKREAEVAAREARIQEMQAEFEKTTTERHAALETKSADVEKLLKLFDEDEEKCLEALANRRQTTVDAFYDKLTRRRLNGGVRAPEDMVAETNAEVAKYKKEVEDLKAEKQAEKDAAKKAEEDRKNHEAWQRAVQQEDKLFIEFLQQGTYPLISEESHEDVLKVARQIVGDKKVTYKEVADYIEQQLSLVKLKEEADARAAAETETPKKSAPEAKGKKPEPVKAKTITNNMSGPRSVKGERTPLSDDQRLDLALKAWPDKR